MVGGLMITLLIHLTIVNMYQGMKTLSENKMGHAPIAPLLLSMGVPIMLSTMTQGLYNIVDSMFIARAGENSLTAVTLIFPVQMVIIAIATGTAVGVNALMSRMLGAGNTEKASSIAMHGIFLSFVLGLIMSLVGLTLPFWFLQLFTADKEIIALGNSYIFIITLFSFSVFGQVIIGRIMQGTGDTLTPMITQMIGAVINIILDPVLIFGYLGFPSLGVKGAAIATVTAQFIAFFLGCLLLIKKGKILAINRKNFHLSPGTVRQIYSVGFPSIILQSVGSFMNVGMNAILVGFGTSAVAFFGIYYRIQSFIFMPVLGLSSAMMSIVAFNYGAKSKRRILQAVKVNAVISFLFMACGTLLFSFEGRTLLALFNASPAILSIGISALRILSITFPIASIGISLTVSFQGMGRGTYSMIMSITRQLLVLLPLAFLFSKLGGVSCVWYAFLFSETIGLLICILFFRKIYREKIEALLD